jgi:glycosyltransferase involved in cell wall biosynthesis
MTMDAPEEPRLSVTLIARDEEDRLPGALASVAFADERIVVVDAASTDRTEEIARRAGARVLVRPFDGFGGQKNAAASLASHRWILSIDADEIVSPKLALEIRDCLAGIAWESSPPAAYRVPIRLEFLGRELRFGRDTVVRPARLYDRERARFSDDAVHEKILAAGPIDALEESILHRSYRDLAHYLEKLDLYTTLAAEAKWKAGKGGAGFLPVRVLWEFFDRAFLRFGFLDGSAGLTFAALSSANTLLKYLKLRELDRAIARGERLPPEGARLEDTASLRISALLRAR